ncbi:MAG: restriction endonuclease subunit S, partial [Anaerolineae bacterium]|nr:restriction endonuclease subunit S [Anaerolineae bacterium]
MKIADWAIYNLASLIVEIESGSRPKGGASEDSGEIPSLGGENIRIDTRLDTSFVRFVPRQFFEKMSKGILYANDVLINKDGANTGKVGFYRNEFPEACINEHVFRLRGRDGELDQGFLFYFLASQNGQQHIRTQISGSAQPGLKANFIDRFPIMLPSRFDLQLEVVKVLSSIDRVIEQTERLLVKQQRVKIGLINDLLTRGLDTQGRLRNPNLKSFKTSPFGLIPNEWAVVTLESLVPAKNPICYGIVQVGSHTPGGVPTIAIHDLANIGNAALHQTNPIRENRFSRSRCIGGDLLLSIKATTGVVGIVPQGFKGNISRDVARIRLRSTEVPAYFKYQLQSTWGQRLLEVITVGTTRREISIAPLRKLLVVRPQPDEQKMIAEKVESAE